MVTEPRCLYQYSLFVPKLLKWHAHSPQDSPIDAYRTRPAFDFVLLSSCFWLLLHKRGLLLFSSSFSSSSSSTLELRRVWLNGAGESPRGCCALEAATAGPG